MSLATTLPVPDQAEERSPGNGERVFAAGNRGARLLPEPLSASPRGGTPRRVSGPAHRSLTTVLRRLGLGAGRPNFDSPPPPTLLPTAQDPLVCRKAYEEARPSLFDDPVPIDELDPLPFIVDDEGSVGWPRPDGGGVPIARGIDDPTAHPRCLAVERRGPTAGPAGDPAGGQHEPAGEVECLLLDVNMSGIALQAMQPFRRGALLDVRIGTVAGDRVVETSGAVVRCEPSKAGGFQVICRLEKYLQFAEIRDIGRDLFASAIV